MVLPRRTLLVPTVARRPRCPNVISGLDAAAAALKRMRVPHQCVFASDLLKARQRILRYVHKRTNISTDILERTADQEEPADPYVTTPPCQYFSTVGKQTGKDGPRQMGALIKKATGLNIKDANIDYPMNACASVDILDGKKCGVCVPCKKDADCAPANDPCQTAKCNQVMGMCASTVKPGCCTQGTH